MAISAKISELVFRGFRRVLLIRATRSWVRVAVIWVLVVCCLDLFLTVRFPPPSTRVVPVPAQEGHGVDGVDGEVKGERIFIGSLQWNDEALIRNHWGPAVLDLARHFGPQNVYVSILEGGSWDDTKGALRELEGELEELGVENSIVLEETALDDEVKKTPEKNEKGWINTGKQRGDAEGKGNMEVRRIPYLAERRNRVMQALWDLKIRKEGHRRRFDKVLWLNDVMFNTEDVTTLLATRNGHFSAVCALDFSVPEQYHDSFALRDINGDETTAQTWPYFLASKSRNAVVKNEPVPVQSCWNGMVIFHADDFYRDRSVLKFRGIPDTLAEKHVEASECCLIHRDNEDKDGRGVWLNPNVRLGYNADAHKAVNPEGGEWPGRGERVWGVWVNRWVRWIGGLRRLQRRWKLQMRTREWRNAADGRQERGGKCLVEEMQVLSHNGWEQL